MLTPHILLWSCPSIPLYLLSSLLLGGCPVVIPHFYTFVFYINFCNATKWLVPNYKRSSFPHSYLRAWSQKVLLDTKLVLSHQWWLLQHCFTDLPGLPSFITIHPTLPTGWSFLPPASVLFTCSCFCFLLFIYCHTPIQQLPLRDRMALHCTRSCARTPYSPIQAAVQEV